ncbi:hypothetical protein [Phaeobacter sp.]|uniref:hypothetical protein n=1 Tax=Phaeobacter sp. TaxID=1902409 RepID=UPI0025D0418C|nr:hypothetical protein [Phaeobacter sp.]
MPRFLRLGLLACVLYFSAMSVAHFFGLKLPLLFVYYDTPFYAYQDKIISFAVLAYVGLFWLASRDIAAVPVALGVLAATLVGLVSVNLSDALASVVPPGQSTWASTWAYWAQTGLLAAIWVALMGLYLRCDRYRAAPGDASRSAADRPTE